MEDDKVNELYQSAEDAREAGQALKALNLFKSCLKLNVSDEERSSLYMDISLCFTDLEQPIEAIEWMMKAKKLSEKLFGPESSEYADCLYHLAKIYCEERENYKKSTTLGQECLRIRKKLDKSSKQYGDILVVMAMNFYGQDRFKEALEALQEAEQCLCDEDESWGDLCLRYSLVYEALEDYKKAVAWSEGNLKWCESEYGTNDPNTADARKDLRHMKAMLREAEEEGLLQSDEESEDEKDDLEKKQTEIKLRRCEGCLMIDTMQSFFLCGKCEAHCYCSVECQEKCWNEHKLECQQSKQEIQKEKEDKNSNNKKKKTKKKKNKKNKNKDANKSNVNNNNDNNNSNNKPVKKEEEEEEEEEKGSKKSYTNENFKNQRKKSKKKRNNNRKK